MSEEKKKKKTTRKVGFADDARSAEDPFGRGIDSIVESEDVSDTWTDADISNEAEDEDSSATV